ncbi:MAG: hypothetical protein LBS59_05360 [Puniceicoccales bacterium]|nr:hypothetical protein [Puniceicoccales bacterium]
MPVISGGWGTPINASTVGAGEGVFADFIYRCKEFAETFINGNCSRKCPLTFFCAAR